MTEQNKPDISPVQTSYSQRILEPVRGWLSLFFVRLIGGGLWSIVFLFILVKSARDTEHISPYLVWGAVLYTLLYVVVSAVAGHELSEGKGSAVHTSGIALLIGMIYSLISSVIQSEPDILRLAVSALSALGWYLYLFSSSQIERRIPPAQRHLSPLGKWFIGFTVLIPLASFIFSAVYWDSPAERRERMIQEVVLSDNERCDGAIVFAVPDEYFAELRVVDGTRLHILHPADTEHNAVISVMGDFTKDTSVHHFHRQKRTLIEEIGEEEQQGNTVQGKVGDDTYYIYSTRVIARGAFLQKRRLYVEIAARYNAEIGKVAWFTLYNRNRKNQLAVLRSLIQSVRFR